jgi:predicted restriction endonuclease
LKLKPNPRSKEYTVKSKKYMYGKFYGEIREFHEAIGLLFSELIDRHKELDREIYSEILELRNKIYALSNSWVGSKKLESKFGIKIPLDSTPISLDVYFEKQDASSSKKYKSCEICGEDRIINYAHIIPRGAGGGSNEKNYLYLCPTHNHIFDFDRLSKEECVN